MTTPVTNSPFNRLGKILIDTNTLERFLVILAAFLFISSGINIFLNERSSIMAYDSFELIKSNALNFFWELAQILTGMCTLASIHKKSNAWLIPIKIVVYIWIFMIGSYWSNIIITSPDYCTKEFRHNMTRMAIALFPVLFLRSALSYLGCTYSKFNFWAYPIPALYTNYPIIRSCCGISEV